MASSSALTCLGHIETEGCAAPTALLHPLVIPEALETHDSSSSSAKKVNVKIQPKFTLFEWEWKNEEEGANTSNVSDQYYSRFLTFVGDLPPAFVSRAAPAALNESEPSGTHRDSVVNFPRSSANGDGTAEVPLRPLEALHPLRHGSVRALCSALLAADRPISIKTLSQRIFDGDKAMTAAAAALATAEGGSKAVAGRNLFRGLIDDLGAPAHGPFASSDTTAAAATATNNTAASSATSMTMSRLLQWALFLSSPAGHVTPLAFITGTTSGGGDNGRQLYSSAIGTVTPQQLKDRSFELQTRFFSFLDERCVLACHVPPSSSSASVTSPSAAAPISSPTSTTAAAVGAPSVLASLAGKVITTLVKQQKTAVAEAATSVHGLLPILPAAAAVTTSDSASFSAVEAVLSLVRKATAAEFCDGESTAEANDSDEDDADVASLLSGLSGAAGSHAQRAAIPLRAFLRTFGPRAENERRYRAVTTAAALIFVHLVLTFVKYVPTDALIRLRSLASDPAAGNKALFSTVGLTVAGAMDMSWLDALLGGDSVQNDEENVTDNTAVFGGGKFAGLEASLLVAKLALGSAVPLPAADDNNESVAALSAALAATAGRLPRLLAEHLEQNPTNAANPNDYRAETAYAVSQRPAVTFLTRVLSLALDARSQRLADELAKAKKAEAAERKKNQQQQQEGDDDTASAVASAVNGGEAEKHCPVADATSFSPAEAAAKAREESLRGFLALDLTFSGCHGGAEGSGKPSSLNIMVIRSGAAAGGSTASSSSSESAYAIAAKVEAIRRWFTHIYTSASFHSSHLLGSVVTEAIRTVPKTSITASSITQSNNNNGKRQRDDTVDEAVVSSASTHRRTEATTKTTAFLRLRCLADLPLKVRFSWDRYYDNPPSMPSSAEATAAAEKPNTASASTLWARASRAEQHWLEAASEAAELIGAELAVRRCGLTNRLISSSCPSSENEPQQAKEEAAAPPADLGAVLAALKNIGANQPSAQKTEQKQQATKDLLPALLEAMARFDVGAELAAHLTVRRGKAVVGDKNKKNADGKASLPLGVVEWFLGHSDAVIRAKCGTAADATKGSNTSSAAANSGSDPLTVPYLNSADRTLARLAQSQAAVGADAAALTSHLQQSTARLDGLKKARAELAAFARAARPLLEAFEALSLDVAAFLEETLAAATSAVGGVSTGTDPIAFEEAQRHPLGLFAKGFGSTFSVTHTVSEKSAEVIPIVDLDNATAAPVVALRCENAALAAELSSSVATVPNSKVTCLTAELVAEIAAFALAHGKRARRLRGLVRIAEEVAKALFGAIRSEEEANWLVSC